MTNIHPTAVIYDNVFIGDNVEIGPFCIIGSHAENKATWGEQGMGVIIGKGSVITGHVTIDSGVENVTRIGKNSFIMKFVHLGHDVVLKDNVTIAPHAVIGGHVEIGANANIGMGAMIHQRCKIGHDSMVGMGSVVTKKTPIWPFGKFSGCPARHMGINRVKMSNSDYYAIQVAWKKEL